MAKRRLPEEFKEFIQCLNLNDVHYLLVGGWAVGMYGHPRATKDIDFLMAIDQNNLEKLHHALLEFGSPPVDLQSFKEKGYVIRIGSSPIQIDIINDADGIDMHECFQRRVIIHVDGIAINIISKEDLIRNKKASGRISDIADAEKLER